MNELDIGNLIKNARTQKGLSQQELADNLNVTRQAVSNWENSISYPDQSIIVKLCKLLDIEIKNIYGDKITKDYSKLLKKEKNKFRLTLLLSIVILIFTCLFTFSFIQNRDTSFYTINIDVEYFNLDNSYYICTKQKNYFNFEITSPIFNLINSNIKIYYLENDEQEIIYNDNYKENLIIELEQENINIDNMFMEINYNFRNINYTEKLKLNFLERFNSKGFIEIENEKEEENIYKLDRKRLVDTGYVYNHVTNLFEKEDKDYSYTYNIDENIFRVSGGMNKEVFNIEKNYANNSITIGFEYQKGKFVTIYLKDSLVKFNNDEEFEYENYLEILNKELAKLESN